MTWRRVSCVTGGCDDCATTTVHGFEDETLTPHYDSIEEATTDLTELGWLATDAGRLICPDCQTRHACRLLGHPWRPWYRRDAVRLPAGGTWSGLVRHCQVCWTTDTNPPLPPAPGHGTVLPNQGRQP